MLIWYYKADISNQSLYQIDFYIVARLLVAYVSAMVLNVVWHEYTKLLWIDPSKATMPSE